MGMEIEGEDTDPGGWVDVVVGMEVKVVMVDMGSIVVVEAMVDMEVAMEERGLVAPGTRGELMSMTIHPILHLPSMPMFTPMDKL